MKRILLSLCGIFIASAAMAQNHTKWGTWQQWGELEDGTYRNPVIPADYSDIDCIRVGNDFYAISSTFQYSPGITMLHSTDLVNWEICSNTVSNLSEISEELTWKRMNRYGRGIWAGTLRYHNGRFYVFFGTPDEGFFMTSASKPEGPWEPLTTLLDAPGWDDCAVLWDKDGKAYFAGTHFADGYKTYLFDMSPDGKKIDRKSARLINSGNRREANKLIYKDGWYYLVFSEHKGRLGRYVMAKRAKRITGPYSEERQLALPGHDAKEPNQGGIVDTPDGKWYFFTHHGTGDWGGRMASLLPVTWIDRWPIIGKVNKDGMGTMQWAAEMPVKGQPKVEIARTDNFNGNMLEHQWQWNHEPRKDMFSLTERPGWLRLKAYKPLKNDILSKAGNTITQRSYRTKGNIVVAKIDISRMADGQRAGLCHFSKQHAAIGVGRNGGVTRIEYRLNDSTTTGEALTGSNLWLKTQWGLDGMATFAYSTDGKLFKAFGRPYQMVWGQYRGDRIGIYCFNNIAESGLIDVDYMNYKLE